MRSEHPKSEADNIIWSKPRVSGGTTYRLMGGLIPIRTFGETCWERQSRQKLTARTTLQETRSTSGPCPRLKRKQADLLLLCSLLTPSCRLQRIAPDAVPPYPPQPHIKTPPYVTARPEIVYKKMSADDKNGELRFIILATDGREWSSSGIMRTS